MSDMLAVPIAAVPYVVIDRDGDHHLVGSQCTQCGATFLGRRVACAACGANDSIDHIRLANTGRVRTCAVINRSYPGIAVPFIAAVVEIDGGGVVRGTWHGSIPSDPVAEVGRPVRICIEDTGQRDASGRAYYSQIFRSLEATV
ncbi:Zn-ribbon domain-containing OB-fold protein [Pseudomonas marginalis]|uniref:Zn-ribbon domain-containing OB-fold protein n=2 Tax=Pseudomonas marginalis TaxID=298 RepID=UPI00163A489E